MQNAVELVLKRTTELDILANRRKAHRSLGAGGRHVPLNARVMPTNYDCLVALATKTDTSNILNGQVCTIEKFSPCLFNTSQTGR